MALVERVSRFLNVFGHTRDQAQLIARAQAVAGAVGSEAWFTASFLRGDQHYGHRQFKEAAALFDEILAHLGENASFNRCAVLLRLGRCYKDRGQAARAKILYQQGLDEAARLDLTPDVQHYRMVLQTELGDILVTRGDYDGARDAYATSLAISEDLGDLRGAAVNWAQLGNLALKQEVLDEATRYYEKSQEVSHALHEPASEAISWHQLGNVYLKGERWDHAERAYRKAAQIREVLGDQVGIAPTWGQLGQVMAATDRLKEAEAWYRKALASYQAADDPVGKATTLHNLALLLQKQPGRIAEARAFAEAALATINTLDPAAAEVWNIYGLLADIADQEGKTAEAQAFRGQERTTWVGFKGARYDVRRYALFISTVVAAAAAPDLPPALETVLEEMVKQGRWSPVNIIHRVLGDKRDLDGFYKVLEEGWEEMITRGRGLLVTALRRLLAGERDADRLCEVLNPDDALIVHVILQGLENPETLRDLLEG